MQNLQDFIRDIAKQIQEAHRQIRGAKFAVEYRALIDRMFAGSYAKTFEKLQAGDGSAIEFGLIFVEVQPYFFRSQYIRTQLIRKLKHAKLSSSQTERLKRILDLDHEKKMKRKASI